MLRTVIAACLLALAATLAPALPSPAAGVAGRAYTVKEIEREIERLLVFYTEDHPDVQMMRKYLKIARQREAEKKRRKDGGLDGKTKARSPKPGPGAKTAKPIKPPSPLKPANPVKAGMTGKKAAPKAGLVKAYSGGKPKTRSKLVP